MDLIHMSRDVRKLVFGVSDHIRPNRAAQLLNMARGLKFWIYEVEGLYYPLVKTKALISCEVTTQLICVFVFAYAKIWFSHIAANINLESFLWNMGKQNGTRYDSTKCGVPFEAILFAFMTFIEK